MQKITTLKTLVTTLTLIVAISLFQGCSKGPSEEDLKRISDLEAALQAKEAEADKETKRALALEEAKRLAEEAAEKATEAEAARLAELAAQVEREKAEKAALASKVEDLNSKSAEIAQQQKSLQDALAQARKERELTAIEANEKVEAAEAKLAAAEASKQAEIAAAREAALAEALARTEQRADKGGYTPATAVVTSRKRESISAFLAVEIPERNFRNNTRRTAQRRASE